jgi:acyl-CoA thioesterase-1
MKAAFGQTSRMEKSRWAAGLRIFAAVVFALAAAPALHAQNAEKGGVLILGDSLTAGYGVDPEQAYPALLQKKIDADEPGFTVINGGVSGDTSAGGLRRLGWLLHRRMDVLVLELGANDGLRGVPVEATRSNLQAIIDKTRESNPAIKIIIAGMRMPPNLGEDYVRDFGRTFPDIAEKNHAALVPFLLEGVAGNPSLNLPDGIHPTPEGHRIVCENVWKILKPVLEDLKKRP